MNFFSRVTYNDRMSPLDFDMFRKMQVLMGVTPDYFEVVLMVSSSRDAVDVHRLIPSLDHTGRCRHQDLP
jgi:chitin synthase